MVENRSLLGAPRLSWGASLPWLAGGLLALLGLLAGAWLWSETTGLSALQRAGDLLDQAWIDRRSPACAVEHNLTEDQRLALGESARLLQASPQPRAGLLLGQALCLLGRPGEAGAAFAIYAASHPDDRLGQIELGFAREAAGDMAGARQAWQAGGLSGADFADSGEQARQAGDLPAARRWYARALEMGERGASFYLHLIQGAVDQQEGDWQPAVQAYLQAVQAGLSFNQPVSSAYFQAGYIYKEYLGRPAEALASFDQALAANRYLHITELANTYCHRADLYASQGDMPRADQDFIAALEILPQNYCAYLLRGQVRWRLAQDIPGAQADLRAAIAVNPGSQWAYLALGDLYLETGQPALAAPLFEQALSIDPSNESARQKLAASQAP
jgi:tetratricopeptide (TPR) repeat protein